MRALSVLFITLLVVACETSTKKQDAKDAEPHWSQELDMDLREAPAHDTLKKVIPVSSSLKEARLELAGTTKALEQATLNTRMVDIKGVETAVSYYSVADDLLKIELNQRQEGRLKKQEFYLNKGQLVLVFEIETDMEEMKKAPDFYDPAEDSVFFNQNKLIHISCNLDCGAPFASEYLDMQEERLKAELAILLAAKQ